MELSLEFMAIVGTNRIDSERELIYDVINKIDRISLSVTLIDFKRTNACYVINGRALKPSQDFSIRILEFQELHIELHMMTRYLLLIAFYFRNGALPLMFWEAV